MNWMGMLSVCTKIIIYFRKNSDYIIPKFEFHEEEKRGTHYEIFKREFFVLYTRKSVLNNRAFSEELIYQI